MTELTHEFTATLPASPERVFAALTEDAQLKCWFAEHVEVDPREGGDFRFWGKSTWNAPYRWYAHQKVQRLQAPSLLVFTWPIDGHDSEVTLALAKDPDESAGVRTILKGRHHFAEAPTEDRPLDLVDDLWRMAMGNLREHLAEGTAVCLPDFTDAVPRIRQTISIDAPRWKVFHALMTPEALDKWIATKAVESARTRSLQLRLVVRRARQAGRRRADAHSRSRRELQARHRLAGLARRSHPPDAAGELGAGGDRRADAGHADP